MSPFVEATLLLLLSGSAVGGALAAQATDPSTSIAPYVGGGAGVIAVGALAEVTRRLLNGSLIPRPTKDYEDELSAAIVAAGQREANAMQHGEQMRRTVDDVREEIASLRRLIERRGEV